MTGEKRIQIESTFTSNATNVYERVEKSNGEVSVTENKSPAHNYSKTTITTSPYQVDRFIDNDGSRKTETKKESSSYEASIKPGYDTSQL